MKRVFLNIVRGVRTKGAKKETERSKTVQKLSYTFYVAVAVVVFFLNGCTTMHITMNPKTPSDELIGGKIPVKVALYMDTEFQNYHWHGQSGAEMSKLDYDLGSASKSLFLESFMLVSKAVVLVNSAPPYSDVDKSDISVVVRPKIVSFSEKHSAVLRVADYHAEITYHVTVYDKNGKVIIEKDYNAIGVVAGKATVSPGSNYAAPAEKAMSNAVVKIIKDISNLKIGD